MKKVVIFLIILLIIASPVAALSVKDFLMNFREIFTGFDTFQFQFCNEGTIRCGEDECGGYPCIMLCQNNNWIEYEYCADQCLDGECIISSEEDGGDTTFDPGDITQTCSDETSYNQCSTNKPLYCSNGNLIQNCNTCGCPTGKECINNECIENEPYDPGGREDDDPNILNIPPTVIPIEDKIIKIGESFRFEIKAIDQDRDPLNFYFNNQLKIVKCSIKENIVDCNAIKDGEETLEIITSSGHYFMLRMK